MGLRAAGHDVILATSDHHELAHRFAGVRTDRGEFAHTRRRARCQPAQHASA
jgi:hypothetical protein